MVWIGFAGFGLALALAMLRVPVALAMAAVGVVGAIHLGDWFPAAYVIASLPFEAIFPYGRSVVPLFIFKGVFEGHSGLSDNPFRSLVAFVGQRPGSLASATIGACAVFGAISGSSLATCATNRAGEYERHGANPRGVLHGADGEFDASFSLLDR